MIRINIRTFEKYLDETTIDKSVYIRFPENCQNFFINLSWFENNSMILKGRANIVQLVENKQNHIQQNQNST